jgi:arsenate reductase
MLLNKETPMKRVLFLCTGNSCHSQMAEVILNRMGKGKFEAFSAGTRPAGYVHPLAIEVLKEFHYATDGLHSKSWEEFKGQPMDFVITVCDRAKEECPVWPGQPISAHWGFEDPAEARGSEEEKLRVFRKVFVEISARISLFVALPMEKLSRLELELQVRGIGKPQTIENLS